MRTPRFQPFVPHLSGAPARKRAERRAGAERGVQSQTTRSASPARHRLRGPGNTQAEAELLTASQAAFAAPQTKARVAQLRAQVKLRRAELAPARDLLDRGTVKADRAGIAVFTDINDRLGKPLSVGERVLTLADPQAPEIDIMVPVSGAPVLEPGPPVELFLNVDPLPPSGPA